MVSILTKVLIEKYRCTSKSTFILFKCSEIFSITMHKYGQYVLLNATPVFTKHTFGDCDSILNSPVHSKKLPLAYPDTYIRGSCL